LGIISFGCAEQSSQGVVARNDEAGKVGQQLAAQVENDKEEVEGDEADDCVDLGNGSLLLEVGESWVLSQLRKPELVSSRLKDTTCMRG